MKKEKKGAVTSMVVVDEKTKQRLLELNKKSAEIQESLKLILETYLNAKGLTGQWQITGDMAALIKVGQPEQLQPQSSGGNHE